MDLAWTVDVGTESRREEPPAAIHALAFITCARWLPWVARRWADVILWNWADRWRDRGYR